MSIDSAPWWPSFYNGKGFSRVNPNGERAGAIVPIVLFVVTLVQVTTCAWVMGTKMGCGNKYLKYWYFISWLWRIAMNCFSLFYKCNRFHEVFNQGAPDKSVLKVKNCNLTKQLEYLEHKSNWKLDSELSLKNKFKILKCFNITLGLDSELNSKQR